MDNDHLTQSPLPGFEHEADNPPEFDSQPESPQATPEWLPERLERARRKAVQDMLTELGVEDMENIQAVLQEREDLQQQLEAITAERERALQEIQTMTHRQVQMLIDAAFERAIALYPFINPQEVRALADLSQVRLEEDGTVTGMREAVEQVAIERPHLLKRPLPPNLDVEPGQEQALYRDDRLTPRKKAEIKRRFRL